MSYAALHDRHLCAVSPPWIRSFIGELTKFGHLMHGVMDQLGLDCWDRALRDQRKLCELQTALSSSIENLTTIHVLVLVAVAGWDKANRLIKAGKWLAERKAPINLDDPDEYQYQVSWSQLHRSLLEKAAAHQGWVRYLLADARVRWPVYLASLGAAIVTGIVVLLLVQCL